LVGFANYPNQLHRQSIKKGFQFNLLVIGIFIHLYIIVANPMFFNFFKGESGVGKMTLLKSLFPSCKHGDDDWKEVEIEEISLNKERNDSFYFPTKSGDIVFRHYQLGRKKS
jgi:septin family protein